jgi:hypothetical protein
MANAACPRCGHYNQFRCPNCGHGTLIKGSDYYSGPYVICDNCQVKWSELRCVNCQAIVVASRIKGDAPTHCFIASELYGPASAEKAALIRFRDEILLTNRAGTLFVSSYYRVSPAIIPVMRRSTLARAAMAALVWPGVRLARCANSRTDRRRRDARQRGRV